MMSINNRESNNRYMSKRTSQLFVVLFFVAVVLTGTRARAQDVYNLQDEFSTSTNSDTTTWSFRYQNGNILDSNNIPDNTIRNGDYTLMTGVTNLQGYAEQNGWANMTPGILRFSAGDGSAPQIIKNITGAADVYNADLTWPSNAVSMYMDQSTLTVLSWLAPSSGTVNINYEFVSEWLNEGGAVMWFVDHGDQTGNLGSGNIADSDSGLQTAANVSVTAGDRINFICEPVPGSPWNYEYTRVIARISYSDATNVVYDDEAQFDGTTNTDTNIWSYRYQAYNDGTLDAPDFTDRNGSYTLIPDNWTYYGVSSTSSGWLRHTDYASYGVGFPDVIQNQTGAAYAYAGIPAFLIPENGIYMDPDCDDMAVVSWLAPSNGTVSILYEFNALDWKDRYVGPDLYNDGTLDYIDKGDSNGNLASIRIDPNTNHSTFLVDTGHQGVYNVTVNAGDRINFVVNPTGRREQFAQGDTTGIFAQIQYNGPGQTPPTLSPPQQTPAGTVYEGDTVTLSVGVEGSLPMYLQWTQNGQPLAGQTSTNLVLTNITIAADDGTYVLIAVNPSATMTSSPVALNVLVGPPVISQEPTPAAATRYLNGDVTFSVSAGGTAPISYQWNYGSAPISGATASSLTLSSLQASNAGSYDVVVKNPYGTNTSSNAVLTVIVPATNYASAMVALGPTAYWRLNETSGTTAYDYMGGYTGTIVGGVALGQPGAAYPGLDAGNTSFGFDGSSGVVETPLLINGFAGTFTALVKAVNPGGTYEPGIMVARGGPGTCCGLGLNTDGLTLQYFWDNQGNTSGWNSGLQITPNTWCFVAVSVGQGQTIMYLDSGSGLVSATNNVTSFSATATGPLFIGYDSTTFAGEPNPYFNGGIDEAAYFNRALAPAEVTALDHTLFTGGPSGALPLMIQPASQSAFEGSAASFTVSAVGDMPLTYQWQFDNANIPGATGQTILIPSVNYTNAGLYQVIVSNSVSGATSLPAQLTVLDPSVMANVTYDLVAHYRFDGDCTDSSGHNHNGVPEGSPPFIAGKIGQAISVSDSVTPHQYVALGDPTDFQFNAGDSFTVAMWLNYTGSPGDLPIIGNAVNSTYQHGWVLADGNCDGHPGEIESSLDGANFFDNDTAAVGGGLLNDGNWHHLAMTIDQSSNVVRIYIDGLLALGFPGTVGSLNTGYQTVIGSDPTGGYSGCAPGGYSIDDMGIWRRALSSAEVAGIYAAGNNGNSFDTFGPVQLTTHLTSTGQLQISWQQGTLESAPALTGPWTPVSGATAPVYVVTPSGSQKFYRVQ